jgi:hypothetical protein
MGFVSGFFVFVPKYKKKLVIFNNPLKVILKKITFFFSLLLGDSVFVPNF